MHTENLKMDENFLDNAALRLLDKLPDEVFEKLEQHMRSGITFGTACSGTDSPGFVCRSISSAIARATNGTPDKYKIVHEFSCENNKSKCNWIVNLPELVCDFDFLLIGGVLPRFPIPPHLRPPPPFIH